MVIAISVFGAAGKMGSRIIKQASHDLELKVIAGTARAGAANDLGIPLFTHPDEALIGCDVAIDFSSKEAIRLHLTAAINAKKALVIGTTGHMQAELDAIADAAKFIPILYSPNFSFGVALFLDAAARFSKALQGTCTVDIIETHHIHKKDCPSGTALAIADAIGNPRDNEKVAICSIRRDEVVGEHSVIFECGDEQIELKHTAHSRDAFAKGALMAAKFLAKQSPGLYSLKDLSY